jgi:hypothetical protein
MTSADSLDNRTGRDCFCTPDPKNRGDLQIERSSIGKTVLRHVNPSAALDGIAAKAVSWTVDPTVRYHEGPGVVPDSTPNSCQAGES